MAMVHSDGPRPRMVEKKPIDVRADRLDLRMHSGQNSVADKFLEPAWRWLSCTDWHAAEPVDYFGKDDYVEALEAVNRTENHTVYWARGCLSHCSLSWINHQAKEQRPRDLQVRSRCQNEIFLDLWWPVN
jgi:hypothetical protein